MWRTPLTPVSLVLVITGNSGTTLDRSNEGLLVIPHVDQHVKEAIFSKNQISEVVRIAFSEATSLMVIN